MVIQKIDSDIENFAFCFLFVDIDQNDLRHSDTGVIAYKLEATLFLTSAR